MAYHIFISEFFSLSLPSYLLLALFPFRSLHFDAKSGKSFLRYKQYQIGNTLTLPSYFICAPVLASRFPPLGTANNIRLKDGIESGTKSDSYAVSDFPIAV